MNTRRGTLMMILFLLSQGEIREPCLFCNNFEKCRIDNLEETFSRLHNKLKAILFHYTSEVRGKTDNKTTCGTEIDRTIEIHIDICTKIQFFISGIS